MVAVGYYPALSGGFVWDDIIFVEESAVHAWSGLWTIWFSPADIDREGHYWPILYTTFWLEHKLWGLAPFGYHLVNVLLYMVNVLLLWVLLRRLAVPGAWAIAAVFAVHPMHVESVAWVMGRKDLLSGLFYMAAALCWIRSVQGVGGGWPDSRDPPPPRKHLPSRPPSRRWPLDWIPAPRPGLYLAALGLFAAAMLSKSVAVTLPVAFAICLWWKNGRVTWADAWRIAPFFLVALIIAVADLSYYTSTGRLDFDYGLPDRVLIAARALWFYAGKLAWPTDLAVVYPLWNIDTGDLIAWGYVIAAATVLALLWCGRHRFGRAPLAGALFFSVTLSPMLGFLDYNYMQFSLVADRYAYLAGIGIIAVLVGTAAHGAGRLPDVLRLGATGALVSVLAIFGKLTWEQAGIYRDEITFYNHILSLNPPANFVHRNLAIALKSAGRQMEALAAGRIAVERRPGSADAHVTLGGVLHHLDRPDEAEESFRRALELDPNHLEARQNMAERRRVQGRLEVSIQWYRRVLDIDPKYAAAHAGIGYALLALKRHEEAVASLARSISLAPESPDAADRHAAMGSASLGAGRMEAAAEHMERALEIDPRHVTALDTLALLRFRQQRYDEALRLFEVLVEVGGASAQVHVNMGATLYHLDRPVEALRSLDRALSLDPALVRASFNEDALLKMRDALRQERQ